MEIASIPDIGTSTIPNLFKYPMDRYNDIHEESLLYRDKSVSLRIYIPFIFPSGLDRCEQTVESFSVRNLQRKLFAERVILNTCKFSQGPMDMLGPCTNAFFLVYRKGLGIDGDQKLPFIGGSNDAITSDPFSHEHDRPN